MLLPSVCNCRCSCGYIGFEALGGLLECVSTSSSVKVYHVTSGTNSKHVFPPGRKRVQEIVFKTMRGCGCVASYGPRDLALGQMIQKIGGECERKFWALGICPSFTWAPITEFVVPPLRSHCGKESFELQRLFRRKESC